MLSPDRYDRQAAVQVLQRIICVMKPTAMTKLHLLKTVFLADRYHLRRYGRLITGDFYVAMKLGPVPIQTKQFLDAVVAGVAITGLVALPLARSSYKQISLPEGCVAGREMLSDTDLEAIDAAAMKMREVGGNKIVNYTHRFPEWKRHADKLKNLYDSEQMDVLDFFLDAPEDVEYCPASSELVAANREYYANPF